MKRCPLLDDTEIGATFTLPDDNPVSCSLDNWASFPILEGIVGSKAEIGAPGVSEILYINAPYCSAELDSV